MSLTPEQYLALSALDYDRLKRTYRNEKIGNFLDSINIDDDNNKRLELNALSTLKGWILIDYVGNSNSGMGAAAFQNPETKEIVFSFRGTDAGKSFAEAIKDYETDLAIASSGNVMLGNGLNQFQDAFDFYIQTIEKAGGAANVGARSFTGHSLGGGLAQYMAYKTNGAYKTVTFDAVGIGQALKNVDPRKYDDSVTDYVNENDFIGMYGVQLGKTVYLKDLGSADSRKYNRSIDFAQQIALGFVVDAAKNGEVPAGVAALASAAMLEVGRNAKNAADNVLFDPHKASSILDDNGNLATETSGGNSFISTIANATMTALNLYTQVANGIHYLVVEIPSATVNEFARMTISFVDGGKKLAIEVAEISGETVRKMGEAVCDIAKYFGDGANNVAALATRQLREMGVFSLTTKLDISQLNGAVESAGNYLSIVARDVSNIAFNLSDSIANWINSLFGGSVHFSGTADGDRIDCEEEISKLYRYSSIRRSAFVEAGAGDDSIIGTQLSDTIIGGSGNDYVRAGSGNDLIFGGDGNDCIIAEGGGDVIIGGPGDDSLSGDHGDDKIYGGDGDDYIYGGPGNDILVGGPGDDKVNLRDGDDIFYYNLGDGNDIISDLGGNDTVYFGEGIKPEDVTVRYDRYAYGDPGYDYDLLLEIKNSGSIRVKNYYGRSGWISFDAMPHAKVERFVFRDGTVWDEAKIHEITHLSYGTSDGDYLEAFDDYGFTFYGLDGDDILVGGKSGDNFLYGGNGNDTLYGGNGNNLFVGGPGDDTLWAGRGSDTFIFNLGDGVDKIYCLEENNTLKFGEGIKPEDVSVDRVHPSIDYDLQLSIINTNDKVLVKSHFGSTNYRGLQETPGRQLNEIIFADGTIWNQETIYNMMHNRNGTDEDDNISAYDDGAVVYRGLAGNDKLTGGPADDILYGDEGDDYLRGEGGDNVLIGGRGDDSLSADDGDDVYVFNLGDGVDTILDYGGSDTIVFGDGILPSDIQLERIRSSNDYNLEISIKGTSDKIIVQNHFGHSSYSGFSETPRHKIESIRFANGVVWTQDKIDEILHLRVGSNGNDWLAAYDDASFAFYGLAGDDSLGGGAENDYLDGGDGADSISGNSGDDTLIGGPGDDRLYGGDGNDVYVFNRGDGADYIYDSGGDSDELHFEYSHDELIFERIRGSGYFSPDLLQIRAPGTGDSVKIDYWYRDGSSSKIETFKSSNGYQITHTQVENLIQAMSTFQQNSGLTWEQSLSTQPSQTHSILQEYWTVPGS